jgi:hypothetical protein
MRCSGRQLNALQKSALIAQARSRYATVLRAGPRLGRRRGFAGCALNESFISGLRSLLSIQKMKLPPANADHCYKYLLSRSPRQRSGVVRHPHERMFQRKVLGFVSQSFDRDRRSTVTKSRRRFCHHFQTAAPPP